MEEKKRDYWKEGLDLLENKWNTTYGRMWHTYTDTHTEQITLMTGGWSENEEVVEQLFNSEFGMFYWKSSERGGKYVFERELR